MLRQSFIALILLAACVTNTEGAITTFFGEDIQPNPNSPVVPVAYPNSTNARASFLATLASAATEDFEGIATNVAAPLSLDFGSQSGTLSGADAKVLDAPVPNGWQYASSGTHFADATQNVSITFNQPQRALGFFVTDIGDGEHGAQITLTLANAGTQSITVPNQMGGQANGSILFFGFVVDPASQFTGVAFGGYQPDNDSVGLDDITIGTIPEPGSLGLILSLGVAGLAGRRRVSE
jgi:hypothetical protein